MPPYLNVASRVSEAANELTAVAELFIKPPSTKLAARVHKNTPALRSLIVLLMAANNTRYLGLQQAQHVALVATIAQEAHRHQLAPLLARLALWLQQDAALESWGSSGHTDGAVDWSNATAGLGMLLLALRNQLEPARDLDACERLAQQVGLDEGGCAATTSPNYDASMMMWACGSPLCQHGPNPDHASTLPSLLRINYVLQVAAHYSSRNSPFLYCKHWQGQRVCH